MTIPRAGRSAPGKESKETIRRRSYALASGEFEVGKSGDFSRGAMHVLLESSSEALREKYLTGEIDFLRDFREAFLEEIRALRSAEQQQPEWERQRQTAEALAKKLAAHLRRAAWSGIEETRLDTT